MYKQILSLMVAALACPCVSGGQYGLDTTLVTRAGETNTVDETVVPAGYSLRQPRGEPLFDVRPGGKLILRNLTFVGEGTNAVSLIRNSGELVVSNCAFKTCTAVCGRGAVYCDFAGARATFLCCTFQGCGAMEGGIISAEASSVSVVSSTFLDNYSFTRAYEQPGGAAVLAMDGAEVSVVGCSLVDQACDASRPEEGRVLAYYGEPEGPSGTYVLNNLWQTTKSCPISATNGVRSLDWRSNRHTADSADAGGDPKAGYGWIASNRVHKTAVVDHTMVRLCGYLHTDGNSGVLYHNADWTKFQLGPETAPKGFEQVCDQLGRPPARYLSGANTGDPLQRAIDQTKAGDTVIMNAGVYDPVMVREPIVIVGSSRGDCIVDAGSEDVCVRWLGQQAGGGVWKNFTFRNGRNVEVGRQCLGGHGGGWCIHPDTPSGVATNCVFSSCSAQKGGGVAFARSVVSSEFVGCTAEVDGGGAYRVPLVDRCHFLKNAAPKAAAVCGDADHCENYVVRASLVELNTAETNAVSIGCTHQFCTIAKNSSGGDLSRSLSEHSDFLACLFTGNVGDTNSTANTFSYCQEPRGTEFVSTTARDYHLKIFDATDVRRLHGDQRLTDPVLVNSVKKAGWLDVEGTSLVNVDTVLLETFLYMGCYAYTPYKMSGLTVTGPDDWYKNTNARTSLREALDMAAYYAQSVSTNLTITFAPSLFDEFGHATLRFCESQLELCDITKQTLIIQGPKDKVLTIDGTGTNRAARVWAGNEVRFENIVFTNCFGGAYGKDPQPGNDGGAILNYGSVSVSNCVFRNNKGGSPIPKPVFGNTVGNGGAIATGSGATTTIYASTFDGNSGAKGGAIWTANGGKTHVFHSTFADNRAEGVSSTDANGGACAMERVNYNVKPTELWLTHCLMTSNRVVATDGLDLGGGIYAARNGLVLLNSVVVGNFVGATTNDIALPDVSGKTSEADFCHTVYGNRTTPKYSGRVTYRDTCVTNVSDWTRVIGAFTGGEPELPTPLPHTVVPLLEGFPSETTYAWATPDFAHLGYGDSKKSIVAIGGSERSKLVLTGRALLSNQVGAAQLNTNGVVVIGPTIYTAPAIGSKRSKPLLDFGSTSPRDGDQVSEKEGVCYITRIDNTRAYYPSVEKSVEHFSPGDTITLKPGYAEATREAFFNAYFDWVEAYAQNHPWFDGDCDWDTFETVSLTLNDKAKPTVASIDPGTATNRVYVVIGNVKENLCYTLGHSTCLDAEPEDWIREPWIEAQDSSDLELSAPKVDDHCFYRVFVTPYVMSEEKK